MSQPASPNPIAPALAPPRAVELADGWQTLLQAERGGAGEAVESQSRPLDPADPGWVETSIPHNWEDYHSYGGELHGNLHGTAWYRRVLELAAPDDTAGWPLLLFEGVGSYADVWLDGRHVAAHAGGRTAFWAALPRQSTHPSRHELVVRARHPSGILDLPHVCGGCWGAPNTEGNQPFGIHRPVRLEWSGPVRLLPFGLYAYVSEWRGDKPVVTVWAELMNLSHADEVVEIHYSLADADGEPVHAGAIGATVPAGCRFLRAADSFEPARPLHLWSPQDPHLHTLRAAAVLADGERSHAAQTVFGARRVQWPRIIRPNDNRNVRCVQEGVTILSHGWAPVSPENNGFTTVLASHDPAVRAAPCGVRVFQRTAADETVTCTVEMTFANDSGRDRPVRVEGELMNGGGTVFLEQFILEAVLPAGGSTTLRFVSQPHHFLHRWKEKEPYLYKLVIDLKTPEEDLLERTATTFGIIDTDREINTGHPVWSQPEGNGPARFSPRQLPDAEKVLRINGEPLFLRGTCEYETLLGADHAFGGEQIRARVAQMLACGFNAFRDAHHPHNLRYYPLWDEAGVVCWTQFGSHIWFDSEAFRKNFRDGLVEWVRERRAHPCVIAWGIQNESTLPEDFTRACAGLIAEWDPTTSRERLVLTCNGGKGGDWNVPQEWSGTYGGNCNDFDLEDLQMVGEYGAWRAFGMHRDTAYAGDENDRSESWACHAMGVKIAKGEAQRDRAVGLFHWLFNTFPNPGRSPHITENHDNGRFGSVNNKGLVTAWGEPCDLFHLFRAAYADPRVAPMVYIVSETWPDRFRRPGRHDNLQVFSNCEEVELFNGFRGRSFGARRNPGPGRPFRWDGCDIAEDLLYAEGRVGGKVVATHTIRQPALPRSEGWERLVRLDPQALDPGRRRILHAIHCGGARPWTDAHGVTWKPEALAAREDGLRFTTWAQDFPALHPDAGSIGYIHTPVHGAPDLDCPLFATYRYGRHRLAWDFPVDAREALVECFFLEPHYGAGGGLDCAGWRLFDVAVNGTVVLRDFDPWSAGGRRHRAVIRSAFPAAPRDGRIRIDFPRVAAGQAVVAAIRVSAEA